MCCRRSRRVRWADDEGGTSTLTISNADVPSDAVGVPVTLEVRRSSCTFVLSRTVLSVGASGGTSTITVTTSATCSWTARSNSAFITLTGGSTGTGTGTVTFTVGANTGAARSGTLTIAGQTVTVNQDAGSTPGCDRSYCGRISMSITMTCNPAGFGWQCTGTVDLSFSPSPRSGLRIRVRLNAGSISGTATTSGGSTLRVPISGSAVACPFSVNPSVLTWRMSRGPFPHWASSNSTGDAKAVIDKIVDSRLRHAAPCLLTSTGEKRT